MSPFSIQHIKIGSKPWCISPAQFVIGHVDHLLFLVPHTSGPKQINFRDYNLKPHLWYPKAAQTTYSLSQWLKKVYIIPVAPMLPPATISSSTFLWRPSANKLKSQIPHDSRATRVHGIDWLLQNPYSTKNTSSVKHAEIWSCWYVTFLFRIRGGRWKSEVGAIRAVVKGRDLGARGTIEIEC